MELVSNPSLPVRLSMRPILMFILLGLQLLGNNYVAVVGFAGGASARLAAARDVAAVVRT